MENDKWKPKSEETDFESLVLDKVEEKPRTIGEIQDKIGKDFGLSRRQTETRVKSMAMSGKFKAHKPKQRASTVFYKSDYAEDSVRNESNDNEETK